ncbi:MAG: sigma 54-interacting transcriptional regulator [Gemmatimonadetes bacterium]|nr:sigma 54-interacting transcriptional regulator [Gemmatimonadota bacterium]
MLLRNPYLNRSMIRSLDGFFGREREIERIMSRLGAATPQSVSIVGQRRIGKSSLLWHLAQPELQARYLDDPSTYLFVYLDFQGQRHLDLAAFSSTWSRQIVDAARDRIQLEPAGDLGELEAQVQQLTGAGLKLVGLFDEFETVTQSSAFGAEFFGFLRSLANSYPVAFVTSSRRELQALCRSQEISESPFFNIFSRVPLGPLNAKAASDLIREPAAGGDHPLAPYQDSIIALAGHLPLFLQIACSAAVECLQEGDGQLDDARLVARFRDEADGHLQYLWEHMEATQQRVLRALLAGEGGAAAPAAAMRQLVDDGFVCRTENGPRPFSEALGSVLAEAGILETGQPLQALARDQVAGVAPGDNGPVTQGEEEDNGASHVLDLPPVPVGASPFAHIVGQSEPLRRVFSFVQRAAQSDATVLLLGETGTGKELIAKTIHEQGPRAAAPFVVVNCGAIAEHLQESELFGHKRGAFTDAHADREGLFEAAHGGTLLLDEIGETTPSTQVKLLRVLQEGEVRRVGETHARKVDVRVICATNRNLETEVEEGRFRQDLYYRLFVLVTRLPCLAQRADDIPSLVAHFLGGAQIEPEVLSLLQAYTWPGNVRELENQLAGAVAMAAGGTIRREHLWPRLQRLEGVPAPSVSAEQTDPGGSATVWTQGLSLRDARDAFERQLLQARMEQLEGEPTKVAKSLGISRSRLYELIRKHDLGR